MPKRGGVPDGLQFLGLIALFLAVLAVPLIWGPETDDPYFQQDICEHGMRAGGPAVITADGMPTDCVAAEPTRLRVTNRLTVPVTLCMGWHGVCDTGHDSPFPGGRVTLRPGESRNLDFPAGKIWFFGHRRTYPVTLPPVSGMTFARPDMAVVSDVHRGDP